MGVCRRDRAFVLWSDLAVGEEKCQSGPLNPTLAVKEPWQCDISVLGITCVDLEELGSGLRCDLDMTRQDAVCCTVLETPLNSKLLVRPPPASVQWMTIFMFMKLEICRCV